MTIASHARARRRPTRAQTRERLLAAAATVFAERGYEQASLDEISATAGLTKGAIYSSFGSKDDLFYALMSAQINDRLSQITSSIGSHTTFAELSRDAGRVLSDATAGDPKWHLTFIEFWTRAMRNPKLRRDLAAHRRAARDAIAGSLEDHAARLGVTLPLPAPQLAIVLLALSNGLAIEQLLEPEDADESLLPDLLEAAARGEQASTQRA
jgi:AcrR family transcriptional regulator